MTSRLAFLIFLLTGCVSTHNMPTFTPALAKPFIASVVIEHRMGDEAAVRGACYARSREGGVKLRHGPPGCSWREGERRIVLCVRPKDFNDIVALVVCGHEAAHHHEGIDHF